MQIAFHQQWMCPRNTSTFVLSAQYMKRLTNWFITKILRHKFTNTLIQGRNVQQ